jgi:hypothetical protein
MRKRTGIGGAVAITLAGLVGLAVYSCRRIWQESADGKSTSGDGQEATPDEHYVSENLGITFGYLKEWGTPEWESDKLYFKSGEGDDNKKTADYVLTLKSSSTKDKQQYDDPIDNITSFAYSGGSLGIKMTDDKTITVIDADIVYNENGVIVCRPGGPFGENAILGFKAVSFVKGYDFVVANNLKENDEQAQQNIRMLLTTFDRHE